ncbi:MAG: multidrug ABC transporter ATP-binding protein [Chloroflexi bacterium HGW-Chloroflexi-8]|jgi:ABC-2 type transport system ATP-binding protein|nr:MAG: multidrug ABC transporter ATP-binding protein [Chloroflexi bacterium HGW-Chloroflexi-8]
MNAYSNAVETSDLTCIFGDFTAVDKVNFYIPKGEIFGLLGPNGAGKTTTIRMLCGIIRPSHGDATVLGYDIRKHAGEIKKQIGYMSQRFSLYDDLTAAENLNFYAAIYGVPKSERKKRIQDLIDQSGLRGYENELTESLSGAWRQRLALACAIAHHPPMLFLDEATAGVDPVSRREFWDLIYEMAAEGISILATTHYMDEAEYCNTIGMMYQSQLVALASPDTLKNELPGLLLQVTCADPLLGEKIAEKVPGVTDAAVHGVLLHISITDKQVVPTLQAAFSQAQNQIIDIELIQPSLEDVFINMVEDRLHKNGHQKQGGV